MTLTPATAAAWDEINTDEGFAEQCDPPVGTHRITVSDTKLGDKNGDTYMVIEVAANFGSWSQFHWLTKNGQPHTGRVKAAKITLRSFGIGDIPGSALQAALTSLVGRDYMVEVSHSSQINAVTGLPYKETKVLGPATAAQAQAVQTPVPPAPAAQQAPPAQATQAQWDDGVPVPQQSDVTTNDGFTF